MLIKPKLTAPFQRGLMPGIVRAVATTLRTRKVTKKAGLLTLRVEAHAYGSVERAKGTKRTLRRAAVSSNYAKELGERLRRIRQQKGMSLQDVQQSSRGRWKAAVVGAYERGDRNVTVSRLAELADFYDVPITELLPESDGVTAPGRVQERKRVILDLAGLDRVPDSERDALARFTTAIQVQRGDFNGRVLTIREDDLMSLALLYQTTADELTQRLAEWGLLAE